MSSSELSFDRGDMTPAELTDALAELETVLPQKLESAAEDIGLKFGGAAAENAPSDTGDLRSDLVEPVVKSVARTIIEIRVGSNLPQAAPHEFGTDPFMPPPSALRDWARRNLGDPDAAYAVAQSISETGIEAKAYLQDAFSDQSNLTFAVDRINDAVTEAFREVGFT